MLSQAHSFIKGSFFKTQCRDFLCDKLDHEKHKFQNKSHALIPTFACRGLIYLNYNNTFNLFPLFSGVIRKDCVYMSTWQSYKCFGLNYGMLVIESLDADTETRRLSPVAVLDDGFVDLINGETSSLQK